MCIRGVVAHLRRMGWEIDAVDDVVRPLMEDLVLDERGGFEILSHAEKHLLDDDYVSPYSSVERAVARGYVRACDDDAKVVSIQQVREMARVRDHVPDGASLDWTIA